MIVRSFTKEELINELHRVALIFDERARGYVSNNTQKVFTAIKQHGKFEKVFSAEINKQRYYQKKTFFLSDQGIDGVSGSVITELVDTSGTFVITHEPTGNYVENDGRELKLLSAHFVKRYFERRNISSDGLTLCEKVLIILDSDQKVSPATVNDDVIRRYGEPRLDMTFLSGGAREIECVYFEDNDIAIVERYGSVPVWRTYITGDLLFPSQIRQVEKEEIKQALDVCKKLQ